MNFVVRVRIETAEAIVSFFVGDVAAHRVGARILKKDHTRGNWIFGGFVRDDAANGAQLCFALGILRCSDRNAERQRQTQREDAPDVHFFPPATGCMRKTRLLSALPFFASTTFVWSAKPFPRTTISYSQPCGTRIANSPPELVYPSHPNLFSPPPPTPPLTPPNTTPLPLNTH